MTNGHYICGMRRKIYREDILKAGLDLMFLHGYNATGIKDITDKVKIPKGSFYNHFASKEEFGLEVLKNYCDNGVNMYKRALLESKLPPLDRLKTMFTGITNNYQNNLECKLGCVMSNFSTELADTHENFRVVLDEEFNRCEAVIEECLLEAQKDNSISQEHDTKVLAGFILNSWHGAIVRMKSTGTVVPLKDFMTLIFTKILN